MNHFKPSYNAVSSYRESHARIVLVVLILALTVSLNFKLTDKPNSADARQNLEGAYNLAYHGIISRKTVDEGLEPSNYREPLPIAFLAAHIALHPALSSGLTAETINDPPAVIYVKQHNLFWAFLCMLGVAFATAAAVRPRVFGLVAVPIAVILTYMIFLRRGSIIDRMMTELQAATLLAWFSFTLTRALKTGKTSWFIATGVLLGSLALTKAYFLYAAYGLILSLVVVYLWNSSPWTRRRAIGNIGLIAVFLAVVTAPWATRNFIQLGSFEIAERGGAVLMIRAYKNEMNNVEFLGAFYHYAPSSLKPGLGYLLGYSRVDLEEGGRLQRLNRHNSTFSERDAAAEKAGRPQDAITFYRSARAERVRLRRYYEEQGAENASNLADRELSDRALHMIADNPVGHLKATVVYLWRGTELLALPIFILAVIGLFKRDPILIGTCLLPAGTILFLALSTHFLPRYAAPMLPSMVIIYIALASWFFAKLALSWRQKLEAISPAQHR